MTKTFSLAGFAVAVLAFAVSDAVNEGYDPLTETISRYVNLPHGWLVTVGLLAVAVGSAAVAVRVTGSGWGGWLLRCWAGCVLVAAVFPADPPGDWSRPSLSDGVHGVAAWAGFLALAIAIVRLTVVWRREPARASKARGLTALAWASSVAFVLFAVALVDKAALTHTAPLGLAERIVLALNLAWLALAATSPESRPSASDTMGRVTSGIVE
ncbi:MULTISPECIES: DUF998 domain-containing protein [unclassified Streptomyces]|uniref:DUF998 domain-containing protein n=1 Tax=unclassified Streptomyces TaxID=2593676 RepID=UPI0006AF7E43|nr:MULTISPECIES: DUF998 domain-containing protein [unclassified Streptomyces]KOX16602.1 hypothetical protein ADL06_33525 [Streptomyces sp. NRRL F-6491]KOX36071.1 hypothetical protein ADL08_33215 [Streptomyces sp. NRRL F-6492]